MANPLIVYTNDLTPGTCQVPVFSAGNDPNWTIQFNNGVSFYNPGNVTMNIGFVRGLGNLTYTNGFQWVDRLNNQHTGSYSIAAGIPSAITWDESPIGVEGGSGAYLLRGRVPPSSGIRKVYVKYGGTGVSSAPIVRFNNGSTSTGKGATATANLAGNAVSTITVNSLGIGYSSSAPPEVLITGDGSGAKATANVVAGQITSITVVSGGSGYTTATVTIRDPEASATASVGGTSTVLSTQLVNPGSGYTSAPTVVFTGGGGASAAATAALANSTWGVSGLTLTGAGADYTSAPTVTFTGGSGSGVAGVANITPKGVPLGVTITNAGFITPGSGAPPSYFSLTFTGGGGSGLAGGAYLSISADGTYYYISSVFIFGGTGYTSAPTATATISWGSAVVTPTFTVTISAGQITSLTLTNPGSGYGSTAPTVGFTGGGGSGATATAQLIGSPLSPVITMTNNGSGYTSPPVVSFSGGAGSGATAVAIVSLGITAITMVQTGFAYTSLPSLSLIPDNGAVLVPSGVESHSVPFIQNLVPATAQGAITVTPYTNGRRDSSGNLVYDDSLLIIRPRYLVQPTLTLQGDALTWAGVFTPVTAMVQAVLNYRRSFVADIEIFGGGRLLFTGAITIAAV